MASSLFPENEQVHVVVSLLFYVLLCAAPLVQSGPITTDWTI